MAWRQIRRIAVRMMLWHDDAGCDFSSMKNEALRRNAAYLSRHIRQIVFLLVAGCDRDGIAVAVSRWVLEFSRQEDGGLLVDSVCQSEWDSAHLMSRSTTRIRMTLRSAADSSATS